MSVTVAELLKLPSLRRAEVVGGARGLSKVVYSISVLESADPGNLVDGVFQKGEFFGSEIVITGFLNCPDDVELQCANIRRLAEGGEVGLILFYVGCFMPSVDRRLIDLADALDFVLIRMPPSVELRYGEVISDVTEAIYHDRMQNESIVSEVLADISRLSEHQRSIPTVLQMLSDRLHLSLFLTDRACSVLNMVLWPRSLERELTGLGGSFRSCTGMEKGRSLDLGAEGQLYHLEISPDGGETMHLFLLKAGTPLSLSVLEQVEDTVRICANIWGREHGSLVIRELIRSIIQDDPMKMRRLSEVFHIDISAIHDMWILDCPDIQEDAESLKDIMGTVLSPMTRLQFGDLYDNRLLFFTGTPASEKEAREGCEEILRLCEGKEGLSLIWCHGLQTTADVRSAYLYCCAHLGDARVIYPRKSCFTLGEIEFAADCAGVIALGEASVESCLRELEMLRSAFTDWDVAATLSCYLLDREGSITRTAEELYLHKNTVKYRLRVISDILGYAPDRLPQGWGLYRALAVRRLLS